jgi:hypothetical protein
MYKASIAVGAVAMILLSQAVWLWLPVTI